MTKFYVLLLNPQLIGNMYSGIQVGEPYDIEHRLLCLSQCLSFCLCQILKSTLSIFRRNWCHFKQKETTGKLFDNNYDGGDVSGDVTTCVDYWSLWQLELKAFIWSVSRFYSWWACVLLVSLSVCLPVLESIFITELKTEKWIMKVNNNRSAQPSNKPCNILLNFQSKWQFTST